jgi:hypothetical protein
MNRFLQTPVGFFFAGLTLVALFFVAGTLDFYFP